LENIFTAVSFQKFVNKCDRFSEKMVFFLSHARKPLFFHGIFVEFQQKVPNNCMAMLKIHIMDIGLSVSGHAKTHANFFNTKKLEFGRLESVWTSEHGRRMKLAKD
jgi:hypothetical protein